jgi:cytochrome P450
MEISDHDEVRAVLADPAFIVPPVPPVDSPVGIAWLRAHVSRFSSGAEHDRRRALAVAALARLDPAELRRAARDRTAAAPREGGSVASVPVETLAAAVGLPSGLAADVEIAAAAYQPHVEADIGAADDAVARLVETCGGVPDEATAVRISLLVQACAATAALIGSAQLRDDLSASVDDLLADTLRSDPPVPTTRRVATGAARIGAAAIAPGTIVTLDLTADHDADLQFGSGLRPCPGRAQALALAAGVLEARDGQPVVLRLD